MNVINNTIKRDIRFDSKRATILLRGNMITRDMIVRDSPYVTICNATLAYADRILRFTDLEVNYSGDWCKVRSGDSDKLRAFFDPDDCEAAEEEEPANEKEPVIEETIAEPEPLPEIINDPETEVKEAEAIEEPVAEVETVSVTEGETSESTVASASGEYDNEYQDYIQEQYEAKLAEPVIEEEQEVEEVEETIEDEPEAIVEEAVEATVETAPIPQRINPSKKKKHK